MSVALPGSQCELLVDLSFRGLEDHDLFLTAPLDSAPVGIVCVKFNPTFPLHTALVEVLSEGPAPATGFCLDMQAFPYIFCNLGTGSQASTLAICTPTGLTPRGSHQGLQFAPSEAVTQAVPGPL